MYNKIFTIQALGIFLSFLLMFVFFWMNMYIFIVHLLSFLVFHIFGGIDYYFDSPYNKKSFDEQWSMNNDSERLIYHTFPMLAITLKYDKVSGGFFMNLLPLILKGSLGWTIIIVLSHLFNIPSEGIFVVIEKIVMLMLVSLIVLMLWLKVFEKNKNKKREN